MRPVSLKFSIFFLAILLVSPLPALAIPAITCHCFKDRSFDPARPAAADPYLLATTQNTFFAIVFNVDKKTIVIKKQQGMSADDLWIAYWIAARTGASAEKLLQLKHKGGTWKDVVESQRLSAKNFGTPFTRALNATFSADLLAETVVNDTFLRYHLINEVELKALREAGASNQELILAALIAASTKQSARLIYLNVKNGSKTWGALLESANINTKNLQQEISNIMKLRPS
jgi:hypothetical protein